MLVAAIGTGGAIGVIAIGMAAGVIADAGYAKVRIRAALLTILRGVGLDDRA